MRGGFGATGRRGGQGAKDTDDPSGGVSYKRFRIEDSGSFVSATTRVYPAGLNQLNAVAGANPGLGEAQSSSYQSGVAQTLYAIPEIFHDKLTISRLLCKIASNAAVGGAGRIGIYRNASLGNPYPGARVADSGDLDFSTAGVKGGAVSVSVSPSELLWFVWICNAAYQTNTTTAMSLITGCMAPILGFQLTDSFATGNDISSGGVGWRHAFTWSAGTALPDPFPSSAQAALVCTTANLAGTTVPAVYFQPDYP